MFPLRLVAAALLLGAAPASAQLGLPSVGAGAVDSTLLAFEPVSQIAAGFGLSTINGGGGEGQFLMLQLQPELSLASVGLPQLGIGLDAPLRFQIAGGDSAATALRFRREDYDDRNEVLSILRYVRFGQKNGPGALYARFGALDFARVGYGGLVESYRNEVGEDARQRGGALDLDLGGLGVETLYGTFAEAGVYAGRAFVRPLRMLGGEAGGWNDITLGVTVAGDLNPEAGFVNAAAPGQPFFLDADAEGNPVAGPGAADRGRLRALGLDLGMRLASSPALQLSAYANANRLADGASEAVGGGLGLLLSLAPPQSYGTRLDVRVEAVYAGAGYQASPFNAFYEVDRLLAVDSVDVSLPADTVATYRRRYQSRRNWMAAQPRQGGLVGQASVVLGGVLMITGRYQQMFELGSTGWFHVGADLRAPGGQAFARAGLDRWNIGGAAADNPDPEGRNLLMKAEAGLYLLPQLMVGGLAQRAFAPVYAAGEVVDFRAQDRLEPVVQMVVPF